MRKRQKSTNLSILFLFPFLPFHFNLCIPPAILPHMLLKTASFLGFLFLLYLMWAADTGHLPGFASSIYHFPNGDKVGHFGLYGIITFFLALTFPRTWQVKRLRIPIVIAAFLIFSVAEEWSQSLFFRRNPDPKDALCSCAGILAGAWAAYRVRKQKKCQ